MVHWFEIFISLGITNYVLHLNLQSVVMLFRLKSVIPKVLYCMLTLSYPEVLPWWVISSGVRQSKITNGPGFGLAVMSVVWLTLSHPEALPWWVISSGHRQSKIHVKMSLFWLVYCRRERIIKEDRQIGPVSHFPPRGSPLMSSIVWH